MSGVLNDCDALLQAAPVRVIPNGDVAAALAAAEAAQDSADAANAAITDMARDDLLSPAEKPGENLRWISIVSERPGIDSAASALGITTERTAYTNAYNTLSTYIGGLGAGFATIPGVAISIVGTTYRTNFKNYSDAKQALLNKIAAVSATAPSLNMGIARNLLANTAPGNLAGYGFGYRSFAANGPYLAQAGHGYEVFSPNTTSVWFNWSGAIAVGNSADLKCGPLVRITPNKRYELSAALSSHRCSGQVRLVFYNAERAQLSFVSGNVLSNNGANYTVNPFPRSTLFVTAPADAAFAQALVVMVTESGGDPHLFVSQVYLGEAMPAQTVGTQWVEGAPSSPIDIGYIGDLNATSGAPPGTVVGSTPATTVEAGAASGTAAASALANPPAIGNVSDISVTIASGGGVKTIATRNPTTVNGTGPFSYSYSFSPGDQNQVGIFLVLSSSGADTNNIVTLRGVGYNPGSVTNGKLTITSRDSKGLTGVRVLDVYVDAF